MDTVNPPLAAETEALRKAYAAFNRNDIAATVEALDPKSTGLRLRSFREVELIMGTKE